MPSDGEPSPSAQSPFARAFEGCLLGGAVGDALGLPREGLTPHRAAQRFGIEPRHALLPGGYGMLSDDTEHACMTAQALAQAGPDAPPRFARMLGSKLRWWMAALPPGVGMPTARACLRLWLGVPPERAGVWSAGNGPAMRAPVLGVALHHRPTLMRTFIETSTALTHRDPKALHGALAAAHLAARAARAAMNLQPWHTTELLREIRALYPPDDSEARRGLDALEQAIAEAWEPARFLEELDLPRGPGGYIHHTMPAVAYIALRHPTDFPAAMRTMAQLGGDADSIGAIAGGIVGARAGSTGIPERWLRGLVDYPRSVPWIRRVAANTAAAVADAKPRPPVPLAWPVVPLRNAALLTVVLIHGLRRLLPR